MPPICRCGARSIACARAADCVHRHGSCARTRRDRRTAASIAPDRASSPTRWICRRSTRSPSPATAGAFAARRESHRGELVLLSVGRLEHNKGFHVLRLPSVRCAITRRSIAKGRWRWVVLGDGPYRHSLESSISDAGISKPRATARPRHRTRAARVVRGGRSVRSPVAVRRQLAGDARGDGARRPVVATTAGGLPDKVRPGRQRMAGAAG